MNSVNIIKTKSGISALNELGRELFRKSLHMLIALVPFVANTFDRGFALALLGAGAVIYTYSEILRSQGKSVAILSGIKELALRPRDRSSFAGGPVTLAFGAMAALIFYPSEIAAIAIYALAFGDGFASIMGKLFGKTVLPYTGGKTVEGSAACFFAVLISSYQVTSNISLAFIVALAVTFTEALPLGDYDNVAIPLVAGAVAFILI